MAASIRRARFRFGRPLGTRLQRKDDDAIDTIAVKCSLEPPMQSMRYGLFEDVGAETSPDRFTFDCNAGFAPPNAELLFAVDFPRDSDMTVVHGKCAVLDRIGRKLMERHGKGLRLLCANQDDGSVLGQVFALDGSMRRHLLGKKLAQTDSVARLGSAQQRVGAGNCGKAIIEVLREVVDAWAARARPSRDSANSCQHVVDTMLQLVPENTLTLGARRRGGPGGRGGGGGGRRGGGGGRGSD